jgi:hypothetical protein
MEGFSGMNTESSIAITQYWVGAGLSGLVVLGAVIVHSLIQRGRVLLSLRDIPIHQGQSLYHLWDFRIAYTFAAFICLLVFDMMWVVPVLGVIYLSIEAKNTENIASATLTDQQ